MKSFVVWLTLLALVFVTRVNVSGEERLFGPNLLKSSIKVSLYREADNGTPTFVSGDLSGSVVPGREFETITAFLDQNKGAYRLADPSLEMQLKGTELDDLGMRHARLQQYHQGVRVLGGELIGHFSVLGNLEAVNGTVRPDIGIDPSPSITAATAIDLAVLNLESFFGTGTPNTPELVVFPWDDEYYLCWCLFLYSDSPMGRWEYLIDAHSGAVVFNANRIMDANDIGIGFSVLGDLRTHIDTDLDGSSYQMLDKTRQLNNNPHGHDGQMPDGNYLQTNIAGGSLPGSIATDADNDWNFIEQAPAVDGHVYSCLMYDYMLHRLGRNSYDDNGSSMLTIVNYSGEGDNNAYWDGSRIVVWSWSDGWRSLAGCPDVIAHEWGHAITEHCSELAYQWESGALNESFSDMIGTAFEFAHDTLDEPDWLAGENGLTTGEGFRDLQNPHNFDHPDFYGTSDPYWIDVEDCTPTWINDYCGVHTNSGVGNKWFYLLSDGGTHHDVPVTGIGVQNALLIAYRANRYYWTSNTDYHNGALGTISAANDLDTTGAWTNQVAAAWNAVGVSTPGPMLVFSYPGGIPQMPMPYSAETFEVVVSGSLGGVPLSGTGHLLYNVDNTGWVDVAMTETSPNHYNATLPGMVCGEVIEFYVRAQDATMAYWYDPDTTDPHSTFPTTGIDTFFVDNFETDMGWSVSGLVSDGDWDRGVPVGGGDRGDPPTDFDGSGACYLTDNVDDNSDVDNGATILTSPIIDLSDGDAMFHYARWYSNDFGADPGNDIMRVYLSSDSGLSWTQVDSAGPSQQASGGWYEISFWASEFMIPTAGMRLQFEVSDLGDPSVIEAGLDDVTVTAIACGVVPPTIITESLPDWTQNVAYSQQLQVSGGTGPLAWNDKFGDLTSSGLTVGPGGLVSGVPIAVGPVSFTAVVIDSLGLIDERLFEFTINAIISITTTTLPDWTQGATYSQQLNASGGTGELTYSDKDDDLSGTGLSLSVAGLLSGAPDSTVTISFTAVATDQVGGEGEATLSLTVNPVLLITTEALPDALEGAPYSQQLTFIGGTGAQIWTDVDGDLSGTGLSLSAEGLVQGTPLVPNPIEFTVSVVDQGGGVDDKLLIVAIDSAVYITTTFLPDWTVGRHYLQTVTASGGWGDHTFIDRDSDLVGTGLMLSSTGTLSGIPLTVGAISFVAQVSDTAAGLDDQSLDITINSAMELTTTTLPDWTAGLPYSQAIVVSEGTPSIVMIDLYDDLIGSGLSIGGDGLVSGTPLIAGLLSFTMQATDEGGDTLVSPFSIQINEAISIVTTSLPDGKVGEVYSETIEAVGGTASLSFLDKNGDLIGSGLSVGVDGSVSGTPVSAGTKSFTVEVSDGVGATAEHSYNLIITSDFVCGDIDGSGSGPDISDLTYLVAYMFHGGPEPPDMTAADVNGSGPIIDIIDLTDLVTFMFLGGGPLQCLVP